MDVFLISGYLGAFAIGVVLGLIGGGGSILTVPVLVYLMGVDPVTATGYSLFVVGTSSLVGALINMRKRLVEVKTAFVFAFPAFVVVYLMRRYVVPALPDTMMSLGNTVVTKADVIMVVFAVIMLITSVSMLRNKKKNIITNVSDYHYHILFMEGILVGVVAGFVGAGGGFLIIPALVLFARLPMKKAVATSLLIISINSLIGFTGDVGVMEIDWTLLLLFTGIAVLGIFLGGYLSDKADGKKLKKGFGWFVLVMALYILTTEFIRL
ncbi:sulfite exporter TauE/SafE family protein [Sinomicrobium soli]|uniref:sulfite exporter TauE/SafE family protein n=1 Tax=Sinomicrobium sp. N-1-3-6 TaxID=2219864 RepID=UPI000DCE3839|nr:sulfite exporter TauE/SafE family protein [Sinomicrobium sp. N-1-3-6]RAV28139.1 sulfite exporter TauE/SafE family protein [Sinomicrobium sp. N-1-3-6]